MSDIDERIIGLLRSNARISVAALAHRLKVSRGTVTNRMKRLEENGVIVGYTIRLRRDDRASDPVHAWMMIAVDRDTGKGVVNTLLGFPFISGLYVTNGRWDLLAELQTSNLEKLAEDLEHVRTTKGIVTSETSIHLRAFRG